MWVDKESCINPIATSRGRPEDQNLAIWGPWKHLPFSIVLSTYILQWFTITPKLKHLPSCTIPSLSPPLLFSFSADYPTMLSLYPVLSFINFIIITIPLLSSASLYLPCLINQPLFNLTWLSQLQPTSPYYLENHPPISAHLVPCGDTWSPPHHYLSLCSSYWSFLFLFFLLPY